MTDDDASTALHRLAGERLVQSRCGCGRLHSAWTSHRGITLIAVCPRCGMVLVDYGNGSDPVLSGTPPIGGPKPAKVVGP